MTVYFSCVVTNIKKEGQFLSIDRQLLYTPYEQRMSSIRLVLQETSYLLSLRISILLHFILFF